MKKEDLKTGMVIKKDNGYFMVFVNTQNKDFYINKDGMWDYLSNLNWWMVEAVYYLQFQSQTFNFFHQPIGDIVLEALWKRDPTHTIQIDGKEIELSEESYNNIKKHFET